MLGVAKARAEEFALQTAITLGENLRTGGTKTLMLGP